MADKSHSRLLPYLDAENETEGIQRALGSGHPAEAEVASALSLRRAAQRPGVWLHLCAHTVEVAPGQRCAMLEDQGIQPLAMKFTPEELEALLPTGGETCGSFVFLAMCHSSAYREAFRKAGFQHIVDCESEVQDKHAAKFAHDLYAALADGQLLSSAFQIAATCAKVRGDHAAYHLEGDGRLQLPAPPARPPVSLPSAELVPGGLPRSAEDFVGRVPQMCEILMAMQNRLVVVLHSTASNGRTATLQQIGQYASRRGRHFASRCAFHPAKAPPGGLLIVDDADEVLAAGKRHELLRHLQSHKGARLLLACREPCYDTFLDCGIKPYNVPLPPLQDLEAAELFLRSTHRPLTAADLSPHSVRAGDESPCRIMPKAEAQRTLRNGIGVFAGEPGKVRKAGVSVRPGSPPLDLPKLVT